MRLANTCLVGVGVAALGLGLVGAAAPAGAASGIQHFTVINTSTADTMLSPPSWLAASGPIHRLGIDFNLSSTKDVFAFHNGTLVIAHKAKHDSQTQDPGSCLFTFTETGTYTVASGTGAYAHAKGSGTYTVTASGIGCSQNGPGLVSTSEIQASGPLSF